MPPTNSYCKFRVCRRLFFPCSLDGLTGRVSGSKAPDEPAGWLPTITSQSANPAASQREAPYPFIPGGPSSPTTLPQPGLSSMYPQRCALHAPLTWPICFRIQDRDIIQGTPMVCPSHEGFLHCQVSPPLLWECPNVHCGGEPVINHTNHKFLWCAKNLIIH